MRHRFTIVWLPFAVLTLIGPALIGPAVAADVFLDGFGDLPVMQGLSPVKDAGVVFDTPSGRIVEAYAAGAVTRAKVRRFYGRTLPQLGWATTGGGRFYREGEVLALTFKGKDGVLTVRFTLSPSRKNKGRTR